MSDIQILKSNGVVELFDENKLVHSLEKSKASQEEIDFVLKTVREKLKPNITTEDLYAIAYKTLNNLQKHNPNAIRYALKRSVMNLGPTGFPFERFLARIFEEMGYTCITGITLQGHCIEHEIDVFAYNDTEAICIEAKFHNEPHLKSDTKVALYVKARFDDLIGQKVKIGQKEHLITNGMLITNTNFTDTAHQYVDCVGTFELLSWSKPKNKNLLTYIETCNLYPITVVPGLHKKEFQYLIDSNILTCRDLQNNISILDSLKMRQSRQDVLKDLLQHICNC
jgi:Holliday junction resolvase